MHPDIFHPPLESYFFDPSSIAPSVVFGSSKMSPVVTIPRTLDQLGGLAIADHKSSVCQLRKIASTQFAISR
jgi:hypothetical protein